MSKKQRFLVFNRDDDRPGAGCSTVEGLRFEHQPPGIDKPTAFFVQRTYANGKPIRDGDAPVVMVSTGMIAAYTKLATFRAAREALDHRFSLVGPRKVRRVIKKALHDRPGFPDAAI
jgi:hypothetical protein